MLKDEHHSHQSAERMADHRWCLQFVCFDISVDGIDCRLNYQSLRVRPRRRSGEPGYLNDMQAIPPFKARYRRVPYGAGGGESGDKHHIRAFSAHGHSDSIRYRVRNGRGNRKCHDAN